MSIKQNSSHGFPSKFQELPLQVQTYEVGLKPNTNSTDCPPPPTQIWTISLLCISYWTIANKTVDSISPYISGLHITFWCYEVRQKA